MRKQGRYLRGEGGGGALGYALVFAVVAVGLILLLRSHPAGGAGQGGLLGGATAAFSGLGQSIGDSIGRSSAF